MSDIVEKKKKKKWRGTCPPEHLGMKMNKMDFSKAIH